MGLSTITTPPPPTRTTSTTHTRKIVANPETPPQTQDTNFPAEGQHDIIKHAPNTVQLNLHTRTTTKPLKKHSERGCSIKGAAAAPRGHGLAPTQCRRPPLRPGSRERPTHGLRLLPPGPDQVRPTNGPPHPYGCGGTRPPAPRGRPSTG